MIPEKTAKPVFETTGRQLTVKKKFNDPDRLFVSILPFFNRTAENNQRKFPPG